MKDKYKIEPINYTITLRATHSEERFPIAYAGIKIEEENNMKVGKLVGLLRHPDFGDEGICNDLFLKRVEICKALNCDMIYSAVYHKRKGIIRMYLDYGFKEIEQITDKYRRFVLDLKGINKGGCSIGRI